MKTVKTISQHGCTYYINSIGNRTYRIAYKRNDGGVSHVVGVYDTIADCESYIRSIINTDAALAMNETKLRASADTEE